MLYLFALVGGFSMGGLFTSMSALVGETFGLRNIGAIFGILGVGSGIGGAIGPVVAGGVFDVTGNYQLAILIFAGVTMIGLILVLLLRPVSKWSLAGNA